MISKDILGKIYERKQKQNKYPEILEEASQKGRSPVFSLQGIITWKCNFNDLIIALYMIFCNPIFSIIICAKTNVLIITIY